MIAYFDTSAFVKLLIDEDGSDDVYAVWDAAAVPVVASVGYVENRAALAAAQRAATLTEEEWLLANATFEQRWAEVGPIVVDTLLCRAAATLAERHRLRAYDAVHLASALTLDEERVFATFDADLRAAALGEGLATLSE